MKIKKAICLQIKRKQDLVLIFRAFLLIKMLHRQKELASCCNLFDTLTVFQHYHRKHHREFMLVSAAGVFLAI